MDLATFGFEKVRQRRSLLKGLIGHPEPLSALAAATDESSIARVHFNTGGAIEREHRLQVRSLWGPGDEWFNRLLKNSANPVFRASI